MRLYHTITVLPLLLLFIGATGFAQTHREDSVAIATKSAEPADEIFYEAIADDNAAQLTMEDWLSEVELQKRFPISGRRADLNQLHSITALDRTDLARIELSHDSTALEQLDTTSEFASSPVTRPLTVKLRSRTVLDPNAPTEAGYVKGSFEGSAPEYYNLFTASDAGIDGALLQTKYAGEPKFNDLVRGYIGMHSPFLLSSGITLSQLVIGNYSMSYGNGLSFGKSIASVKTSEAVSATDPHSSGIVGAVSSTALLGAATCVSFGRFSVSGFYSKAAFDANYDTANAITSIFPGEYHRTATEIARSNNAEQTLFGGHLDLAEPISPLLNSEFGLTGYSSSLNSPISPAAASTKIGTQHESLIAMSENAESTDILLAIEEGVSISDTSTAFAFAGSLTIEPTTGLDIVLQYRKLPPNYLSRSAAVFGERSAYGENENGAYLGLDWRTIPGWLSLSAYSDLSTTIATTATSVYPINTKDYLLHATLFLGNPNQKIELQYRLKSVDEKVSGIDSSGFGTALSGIRAGANYLMHGTFAISRRFCIKVEGQAVNIEHTSTATVTHEVGYLASFGSAFEMPGIVACEARATYFNTPSFNTHLNSFEPDVPGAASFSPLYMTGERYLVFISAWPAPEIRFSAKIVVTAFPSLRTIGSGFGAYVGSSETRVSLQCDVAF